MANNKLTTEEFVEKAKKVHGDRYDYSKTVYQSNREKLCIICPVHGEFWQTAGTHLKGSGCPECFGSKKKTTEQFVKEAMEIHGDEYDYSKTVYTTKRNKVCITCKKHGDFWVLPGNHLRGKQFGKCPKCENESKRQTTEQFVELATKAHNGKYDYSKVDMEHKREDGKVCIICPKHGEFWQKPASHLVGNGCKKCKVDKLKDVHTFDINEFIRRAKKTHGDKYDYSKTEYINSSTKVLITCPIHGDFWQTPIAHITGQGCPVCGGHMLKTTEMFISDARKVHGDRYDYSKVKYVNSKTKVCIICPKHGEFWQSPNCHLKGECCPQCSFEKNPIGILSNKEEFVEKARKVHGDKYNYDEVVYEHSLKKVRIICPKHGPFMQTPANHISGTGCPKCKESSLERSVRVELEKIGVEYIYSQRQPWLGRQTLDFFIPSINVAIECQGIQHYIPTEYFKGESGFENLRRLDERKRILCDENSVKLYYITEKENSKYQPEAYTDAHELIKDIFNLTE